MKNDAMPDLDRQLSALRSRFAGARSSPESRESLMRRFDQQRVVQQGRKRWAWALPMAAALLFGMVLLRHSPQPVHFAMNTSVQDPAYLASSNLESSDAQDEGFIAVPYVPPLASGELVRVVHTELRPSALASLGINVDPTWTTGIAADLLMGEDGFPRAVRLSNEF